MKKILIAGGTGFVGETLIINLVNFGYSVHVLTRSDKFDNTQNICYYKWDIKEGFIDERAFEGITDIINLTGANITEKRWTEKRKAEIIESRTKAIDLLSKYVRKIGLGIDTFISSSAVGYYGTVTTNQIFTEDDDSGSGFLSSVCEKWEKSAMRFEGLAQRTIVFRKGIILGKEGGIYAKLAPLAKWGINISLGNGRQYLPWIDIRDLVCLYNFVLATDGIEGVFNTVSSQHITMNHFSKSLLKSFEKTSFIPNLPKFLIKLTLGEMSAMLLEGSRVSNEKIKQSGFHFKYDTIEKSLCV